MLPPLGPTRPAASQLSGTPTVLAPSVGADAHVPVIERGPAELAALINQLQNEIRQRHAAEAELQRTGRIMQMVSECNQAMVRLEDEQQMMQEICRIIVEAGGYRMAWVGYAENDAERSVRPVAHVGFEQGYLEHARISWADIERGRGPTGSSIRLDRPCISRDFLSDPELEPWRKPALERGFRSSIALPLRRDGKPFGALTIYATQPNTFGEAQILSELAGDLAFGISTLRTRQALRESQQHLRQVLQSAPVVIWAVDRSGTIILADGELEPLKLTPRQLVGRNVRKMVGDRPDILRHIERAGQGEQVVAEVEYRGLIFEARYSPVCDDRGQVTGVMCVATDITERRRSEREVLQATEREQRRIGRDLHDGIQSTLAGVGFLLAAHKRDLTQRTGDAALVATADHLADIVHQTLQQTRGLARGLCPVDLAADGLMKALEQLAGTTTGLFRIDCRLDCPIPVFVRDERIATQLYYIAREAVNNSVKHAQASQIVIRLQEQGELVTLTVVDDGIGIAAPSCPMQGMGLRTMGYRAKIIGADLVLTPGPEHGTTVRCTVPVV